MFRWLPWLIYYWLLQTHFLWFDNIVSVMQDLIPKCSQNPNISGEPGYLFQKLKALTSSPTAIECNIFCWNFAHVFCNCVYKRVFRIFFVLFRFWVINKNIKNGFCECVETRSFLIFANMIKSKQNGKKSNTLLPFCRHW